MIRATPPCTRCHSATAWSSGLCWECHRAYSRALRDDSAIWIGFARGLVLGLGATAAAIVAGVTPYLAIAAVPFAVAFASHAQVRRRRAWIARAGAHAALPEARVVDHSKITTR